MLFKLQARSRLTESEDVLCLAKSRLSRDESCGCRPWSNMSLLGAVYSPLTPVVAGYIQVSPVGAVYSPLTPVVADYSQESPAGAGYSQM